MRLPAATLLGFADDDVVPTISDLVRVAVALHVGCDSDRVELDARLEADLGLDPLDVVLVVLRIEELTGGDVAIANLEGVSTVRELVNVVSTWSVDDVPPPSQSGFYLKTETARR